VTGKPELSTVVPIKSVSRRMRGSMAQNALSLGTSLVAYVVIGAVVEPAEYGRAAVVLACWGLLTVPIECTGNLLMRYGPVDLARTGTLRVSVSTRLVFALPPLLLLLPSAPLYLAFVRGWPTWMVLATMIWLLFFTSFSVTQWSGVAAQRFGILAAAGALNRSAPIVMVFLLSAIHAPIRAEAFVLASLVGLGVGTLVPLLLMRRLLGLQRPDRTLLVAMWRYALPSLVVLPIEAAIPYVDPLVLSRFVSNADVGRYQLAYAVINLFGMLGASFNSVLSPELVRTTATRNADAVEAYRRRDQPRFAVFLGLAAFGAACLVGPLARMVLPARFASTSELLAILTLAGGFMIGAFSLYPLATVTDSMWSLHLSFALSAVINFAFDLGLAPRTGSIGVAEANVIAWAVQFVALTLLLRRRRHVRMIAVAALVPAGTTILGLMRVGGLPRGLLPLLGGTLLAVSVAGACRIYRARLASCRSWAWPRSTQRRADCSSTPRR
jgi:O-antigen/teichoic acid export membrane protein